MSKILSHLLECNALRFGEFTLKSGRVSPYFVNMGAVCSGRGLSILANCYAELFNEHFKGKADNLFGPAYKGIPLCASVATAIDNKYGIAVTFTYNRKEIKDHGEGGVLVGNTYNGGSSTLTKVVIIEDVITAGTSIEDTMRIFSNIGNAKVVGLLVAMDRREKLASGKSALGEVSEKYGIETHAISTIDDILEIAPPEYKTKIADYREKYGV
ncbi:orotate phosphoribosyltransferase [Fibrobacterales bacterium]|nr:orotate phosphoribosyltransferase [Fibrobacterales bacterium]